MVNLGNPVYVTVRAVTSSLGRDINNALRGSRREVARNGEDLGRAFTQGFNRGIDVNVFRRVTNGLRSMVPEADSARKAFSSLIRTSYTMGTALALVVGGISSVISALGALGGAAGGAVATVSVLGNAMFALGAGMIASRLALSGVGQALSRLNQQTTRTAAQTTRTALQQVRDTQSRENAIRRIQDAERALARTIEGNRDRLANANNAVAEAQAELNAAIRAGREELQQLGFEAEDAALSEQRAALELERARETLARVQDLPPNNRARREAELAFAEAELNYRKAKDANADLAAEQNRLAQTGVNGLDSVIDARNKLADAEQDRASVVKDALQDEEDALRNVAEARRDAQKVEEVQQARDTPAAAGIAALGGEDPLAGLNAAQRRFVLFLHSMRPLVEELQRIAAEAFLPRLETAIRNLADRAFPTIATGIGIVAAAMGEAAITLVDYITTGENLEKLGRLFESSGRLIETMGSILGRTYDVLLSILDAAAPIAERFFNFIDDKMGQFADHLNSVEGNAQLERFFERAAETAEMFGSIFGNLFAGIGAVIDANMGPGTGGYILLEYLERVTSGFGNSPALVQFFADVATNAVAVLDTLGSLFGILGEIGADQSLGDAFRIFLEGEDSLRNILQTAVDAAPSLATLVVTITDIVSALADTGAMQVFFDVLNEIGTWVADFVSTPAVKEFLDFFGRIFAAASAFGLVFGLVGTGAKIFIGVITALLSPLGALFGLIKSLWLWKVKDLAITALLHAWYLKDAAAKKIAAAATVIWTGVTKGAAIGMRILNAALLANPIGLIITAITLLVGSLTWFFTQTEIGKKAWEEFTRFLGEAWANVVKFFEDPMKAIQDMFQGFLDWIFDLFGIASPSRVFMDIGQFIIDGFFNGIKEIGKVIGDVFNNMLNFVVDLFMNWTVYGLIIKNWDNIVKFFGDVWDNIMGFFDAAFQWIDRYVILPFKVAGTLLGIAFQLMGKVISDVWTNIQKAIDAVWKWIDTYIFKPIRDAIGLVGWAFENAGAIIALAWETMQDSLRNVWLWIDRHVFNPIRDAVDLVQDAFENVADGIAKAWDGIKKAAAVPVNFVIDTIYNNGIRSFWNDLAGALNMNDLKLPKAKTVKFASGGVMPGYTPGRDVHRFYSPTGGYLHLSGGEAIMRPEWTRAVGGPKAVERMNRAARRGSAFASGGVYGSSIGNVRKFASGGVVDFAGDILEGLAEMGKIIGDFFADPVGAVKTHLIDGVIKPLTAGMGDGMFADLVGSVPATIADWVGKAVTDIFGSQESEKPANAIGWRSMWDVVKTAFPWATLNSSVRSGAITANGTPSYHASGRAIDTTASMRIFDYLRAAFPNSRELIYSPAGSRQLWNGKNYNWGEPVKSMHYDHVHWAMAKGGTVYPQPGGSIVNIAEAGQPERVEPLDPDGLSDRDKAIMDRYFGGGNGDVTINVYQLPGEDPQAFAERVSRILSFDQRRGGTR